MPVITKTGICPVCDRDVDLKRGKVADHPAEIPAKGKATVNLCTGSGGPPKASPVATDDGSTPPPDETVLEPSLDHALADAGRPAGAWAGAQAASLDPAICDADPNNSRSDVGDVTELALSLSARGMLEPVIVTPGPIDDRYTIVVGHRRVAAAIVANLPEIPALIRVDLTPGSPESLSAQVVENLHRVDLTPLEEARSFDLLRHLGMKQAEIAAAVGVDQGQVSKRLALLKLPDDLAAKIGDGEGLDVATAVELSRLPDAARADVVDKVNRGADPDKAVRAAKTAVAREAAHTAVIDTLETAGVALVDFPTAWHWGREREDRPLLTGPDGEKQAYGGARTLKIFYAEHASEPCHGAAVSDRDEVIYVCLDPTRHGYATAEQEAEALDAERALADEAREMAQATAQAALQARRDAARTLATSDASRPAMTDVVAAWIVDNLAGDPDGPMPDPLEILAQLVEWSGLPPAVDDGTRDPADLAAAQAETLVDAHGHLRTAYMAAIAGVELLLDQPAYIVDRLSGSPIIRDHYARLEELAGYTPTDAERLRIVPPDDRPVELPDTGPPPPDGALGWYDPTVDAAADGDQARWIADAGELDAIIAAGFAHRVVMLPEPDAVVDALDPAAVAAQEIPPAPTSALDALVEQADTFPEPEGTKEGNADDPEDLPPPDETHLDPGDRPTPGELCPASRRDFNTPGNAVDIACPLKCGALVSTTERGRVRDHDVPDPEAVEA